MKILYIGDIVARPGRKTVKQILPDLRDEASPDLVVANAENIAHGRGATERTINEVMDAGVDFFTSGDHILWRKKFGEKMNDFPIIRPANYPDNTPGKGYDIIDIGNKGRVLLINLMGRTFLNERLNDPFTTADEILEQYEDEDFTAKIIDFHAEATSEKMAFAFYLDGRVDAVVGTHTHVATCDNRQLPKGTLYVTDIGMTGIIDSVLGVEKDIIIELYLTARNQRFEWEDTGKKVFSSVIIDTDKKTIERFDKYLD